MSENWWEKDEDKNGIPDVIDEAREVKRRFGVKNILIASIIGLIIAGYGIGGYFYMNLKDDYVALQQQYDWQQTEDEIEINSAIIAERREKLKELLKAAKDIEDKIDKAKASRKDAEHEVVAKPYARRNEHEASKMDSNDLVDGFNKLGFPAKSIKR